MGDFERVLNGSLVIFFLYSSYYFLLYTSALYLHHLDYNTSLALSSHAVAQFNFEQYSELFSFKYLPLQEAFSVPPEQGIIEDVRQHQLNHIGGETESKKGPLLPRWAGHCTQSQLNNLPPTTYS